MSNELPWQVWTPDDLAPPPETFVPVEADNVTLTDDTPGQTHCRTAAGAGAGAAKNTGP